MPAASPSRSLPVFFGRQTHLLGWQGFTATVPENWNPAKFGGSKTKGELRVDDEDGPRLELRWEASSSTVDVPKSVEGFLKTLEKNAKKQREAFQNIPDIRLVSKSRKHKDQITSFAWRGEGGEHLAGCGFGVAWSCPDCERITFAHVIGRGHEKPEKIERLASEVFSSLECHGKGGWETWSAFDLQVEVPAEFGFSRGQMLINKLEWEWTRPRLAGLKGLGTKAEKIGVRRFPIANVLLEGDTLGQWANRTLRFPHKTLNYKVPDDRQIRGHEALIFEGGPRDWRMRLTRWVLDKILRRHTLPAQMRVWHCPQSNRIYVLETDLSQQNSHVAGDVLESLECH